MKLVILESPYAGKIERNIEYAKCCIKHMLSLDEAPIASHLLFTQPGILDDTVPRERSLGMAAGWAWRRACDYTVHYWDFGMSSGMLRAKDQVGIHVYRHLPEAFWSKLLVQLNDGKIPTFG